MHISAWCEWSSVMPRTSGIILSLLSFSYLNLTWGFSSDTQVHSLLKINSCQLYFLWVISLVGLTWRDSKQRRPQNRNSTNCQNFHLRILSLKESYLPNLHCARLLLLLFGVSLQAIPYLGMNFNRGRDRKIVSSLVEVIKVSDSEENNYCHISDGNLSEQGQVEVNTYGSPVAAQDIARGGKVLVATDENVVRTV